MIQGKCFKELPLIAAEFLRIDSEKVFLSATFGIYFQKDSLNHYLCLPFIVDAGTMHWFDRGEEYEGEWVKGIQNGNGKHVWYSKRVTVSQYPIRNEYEGNFIDGQRHGFGVFRYASGAKYSGYWKKNLKSGKGEFMFKNGSIFKG